jgi:hypothetical protein
MTSSHNFERTNTAQQLTQVDSTATILGKLEQVQQVL